MKRVLVTGGAGFIGSHLCKLLMDKGYYVICLDNFFTGSIKNIDEYKSENNFEFINHDITHPLELEIDEIYNLACPASPVHYQKDPIYTWKTSIFGTYNMLQLAKRQNAILLHSSTSEVYGDPTVSPQIESYWGNVNPIGERSCYDEGKRASETIIMDYHRMYDIDIRLVRIFNTYGPKMRSDDGRVVSNFIVQAIRGDNITIYGDGSQTRSFCYVDDMTRGLISMMENDSGFIGPVNLGNPGEFTIRQLAEKVINMTETHSKIVYNPLPPDDPKRRKPDISLAKEIIDWKPHIPLDSGLQKTFDYFKKVLLLLAVFFCFLP